MTPFSGDPSPAGVTVSPAALSDAHLLENLLELYIHDLSAIFPDIPLGPDGRFGYRQLPRYWTEPGRRFPFLIRVGTRVAGFALVTRGIQDPDDGDGYDMAEFFVLRRDRRSRVGREAAMLLWAGLPGRWTVRVSQGNRMALPFWSAVTAAFTGGTAVETVREGVPYPWRVYSFVSQSGVS